MLFLSAIATSMDSFIMGISFKISKTKLTLKNIVELSLGSFLTITFFHITMQIFHISVANKFTKFLLFLILGIFSLKKEEKKKYQKKLTPKEILLIILSNSIDGFLVSLTFTTQYSITLLSFIYAITGIFLLLLGNKTPISWKKRDYISTVLFFVLAITSLF